MQVYGLWGLVGRKEHRLRLMFSRVVLYGADRVLGCGESHLTLALYSTRLMVSLVGGVVRGWKICVAVWVLRSMEDLVLHRSQVGCVRKVHTALHSTVGVAMRLFRQQYFRPTRQLDIVAVDRYAQV
jgi:hypothetical protein